MTLGPSVGAGEAFFLLFRNAAPLSVQVLRALLTEPPLPLLEGIAWARLEKPPTMKVRGTIWKGKT